MKAKQGEKKAHKQYSTEFKDQHLRVSTKTVWQRQRGTWDWLKARFTPGGRSAGWKG